MKPVRLTLTILATFCFFAAAAQAQTIKSLGYNTTNGQVVAATNITFTNAIKFTNNAAAATRTNLGLGATNIVEFDRLHLSRNAHSSDYTLSIGQTNTGFKGFVVNTNDFGFYRIGALIWYVLSNNLLYIYYGLEFASGSAAATTRTNLGLGLPALTNTSNVTMMRALSGSTNTNHPFSGTVSVVGTNNTNTLTFSNGILQSVQ